MSADTKTLNRSFFWWNDNHWNITYWSIREGFPHSFTSQTIKTKPAKNSLVRGIVEVGLNPVGQGPTTGHDVLLILFEGSLTVARGRGTVIIVIQGSPTEPNHDIHAYTKLNPDMFIVKQNTRIMP